MQFFFLSLSWTWGWTGDPSQKQLFVVRTEIKPGLGEKGTIPSSSSCSTSSQGKLMMNIRGMYGKLCHVPNMYWNVIKMFTYLLDCLSGWFSGDLNMIWAGRAPRQPSLPTYQRGRKIRWHERHLDATWISFDSCHDNVGIDVPVKLITIRSHAPWPLSNETERSNINLFWI